MWVVKNSVDIEASDIVSIGVKTKGTEWNSELNTPITSATVEIPYKNDYKTSKRYKVILEEWRD